MASNMETRMSAPWPLRLAPDQGLEDGFVGVQARADVDEGDADASRRLGAAGQGSQTRLGLDQQVIGLALAKRPCIAITGDGATDQTRGSAGAEFRCRSRAWPERRA